MTEEELKEKQKPSHAREIARRILRHENAALGIVLVAIIAAMGVITNGITTSRANMSNVLLQGSIRGVASVGQAFVILTAGIDISIAGVGLMSSIVGASLLTQGSYNIVGYPVSMFIALPLMLLVGAGWGAINGVSVSRIGLPALIVTLAMWQISKGAAFQVCKGYTIAEQPDSLAFIGSGTIAGVPVAAIIFLVVAVIAYFVLEHTTFGRSVYAVGGNPVSAWLSGIKVKNILFTVYVISGFLAGLAGVISMGRVMSASMLTLTGLELDCIGAVVIGGVSLMGGRGSLIGVAIGVLIISVINNGMSVLGASPAMQGIVKGAIIYTAVTIDYMRRR